MDFRDARERMVEQQLAARGISDPRVLQAFRDVPREAFVAESQAEVAYEDNPLPIGDNQTISQPYVVAVTIEAMRVGENDRVLEVGTGSGYVAALLSRLAREVFTVERIDLLARSALWRLARLTCWNVRVHCGDGSLGWPEHAPYDAIAVAAGGPEAPLALLAQLAPGGRLVMPIGGDGQQVLTRVTRPSDGAQDGEGPFVVERIAPVRFVPLIGAQGWPSPLRSGS